MEPKKPSQDREAIARLELLHLQRQCRLMQYDMKVCPRNKIRDIAKQQKILKDLESEKEKILVSQIAYDQKQEKDDQKRVAREVLQLLLERKQKEEEISVEKANFNDLKTQIEVDMEKVDNKIRTRGGARLIEDVMRIEEKSDENQENRLHHEACKYNDRMMRNASYGRQVEDLIKERERFQQHLDVLSKNHVTGEKTITDLLEQSRYAFDQRREADSKLNALKSKEKQKLLLICSDAKHLERNIVHVTKLNAFLAQKSQRRIVASIEEEESAELDGTVCEMTDFLEKYGLIVKQIQEQFGEDDMDRTVIKFMELETDYSNMRKFINDLNAKLEQMRGEICKLQQAITEQKRLNEEEKDKQLKIIENLESEAEIQRRVASQAHGELNSAKEFVDTLLGQISSLFFLVDCNADEILSKLGKNQEVRPDNIMMYLRSLERRFKDLKIVYDQRLPRINSLSSLLTEQDVPACKTELPEGPCPLCAELKYFSEVDEAFVVPLTIDEMRKKLHEELKKGFHKDLLHSVANCHLAKSRRMMQKRKGL